MDFGLVFLLLVWKEEDFDVRVRGAAHVQGGQFGSLQDADGQLGRE